MKPSLIHLRMRIERRIATMPYRRAGSVAFWIAGVVACITAGLTTTEAPLHSFIGLLVGVAYIAAGALIWGIE